MDYGYNLLILFLLEIILYVVHRDNNENVYRGYIMGSASFWLVLVVAACVIALIVVNAKRKSLEEISAPHDDRACPPEPPPIKIEPQDDKVESIGSQGKLYG